jgi:hypothetical protein
MGKLQKLSKILHFYFEKNLQNLNKKALNMFIPILFVCVYLYLFYD